jgi:hypothetical protein
MFIKDLSKELDAKAMSAVRGGDNGTAATSNLLQEMGISAPVQVGYGAGSAGNTFVHVDGTQNGSISTHQTSGDKFAAFLGTVRGLV